MRGTDTFTGRSNDAVDDHKMDNQADSRHFGTGESPIFWGDGPKSVESLAKETDTHAPTLFRILRALSSVGIFVETEERVFGLSPLSRCLLSDGLRPIARMFLSEWHDKAWNGLSQTVRTGEPGFDHAFGKPPFEWFEENPVERSILDQGQ